MHRSPASRRVCFAATRAAVAAALCLGAAGCASEEANTLGAYLDKLEFDAPLASVAYVSLGKFDVPVPTQTKGGGKSKPRSIWVRLTFELFAEASPEHESALKTAVKTNRGALNDALLTVVRTSSAEELTDPRLSALKMRMTEASRPLLGERTVRQLVLDDLNTHVM